MDIDFGTVIYVILAVVYFIIQSNAKNKKKREQAERFEEKEPARQNTERRPTFEELLEEFTGQKKYENPVPQPVIIEEPLEVEEVSPYKSSYEIAKEKTDKRRKEAELEAARIRSEFNDRFAHFEVEEEEVESDYAEMFSDLDSAKKAFVASEIFNRKFN